VREDERDLPAEIASALAPHLRHALSNLTRRRILRALNRAPDPQTVPDLFDAVPALSLSSVSYHVNILRRDACVSQATQIVHAHGTHRAYASTITGNLAVISVLNSTEREDERLGN
jgi:DNA-binding transcriptional ArsR family regulator